jgi:hypothetical protein
MKLLLSLFKDVPQDGQSRAVLLTLCEHSGQFINAIARSSTKIVNNYNLYLFNKIKVIYLKSLFKYQIISNVYDISFFSN